MKIVEEVVTRATSEKAWELIADPSLHSLWNPRIVATQPVSSAPGLGQRYRITYELKGRRSEFDAEVTEFAPPTRWVARLEERAHGRGENFGRYMIERYMLKRRHDRTQVRHQVVIHHSGVNVFLRALIWFIMKTGKPTGQTFMERFRQLAEDDEPGPTPRSASGSS